MALELAGLAKTLYNEDCGCTVVTNEGDLVDRVVHDDGAAVVARQHNRQPVDCDL